MLIIYCLGEGIYGWASANDYVAKYRMSVLYLNTFTPPNQFPYTP